jgi:hypothetical protein
VTAPDRISLVAAGGSKPRAFALVADRVTVGSVVGNDLVVEDPTVSRQHAALARVSGEYRIHDTGSTNGTFLNGVRLRNAAAIRPGDEIRFGSAAYTVQDGATDSRVREAVRKSSDTSCVPSLPASTFVGRRSRKLPLAALIAMLFVIGFTAEYLIDRNHIWILAPPPAATAPAVAAGATTATPFAGAASPVPTSVLPESAATPSHLPSEAHTLPARPPPPPAETAVWLGPLNEYRAMLGLRAAESDPALSAGDSAHARYLVKNFGDPIKAGRLGAEAHSENTSLPFASVAGGRAAAASDIEESANPENSSSTLPRMSLDGWMSLAFHRFWIINPGLRTAGYGQFCEDTVCVAGLDLLSGAANIPPDPAPFPQPLKFPPAGGTTRLNSSGNEWPNPLTACPGYNAPTGLPITLELGTMMEVHMSAYSLTLNGTAPAALEACGFDAASFANPDPAQQSRAKDLLHHFGAVVVIPRAPLNAGNYSVSITANGHPYKWSFAIEP